MFSRGLPGYIGKQQGPQCWLCTGCSLAGTHIPTLGVLRDCQAALPPWGPASHTPTAGTRLPRSRAL